MSVSVSPPRLREALEPWCAAGMSGAVRVLDPPTGAVYLVDGLVAYAECPALSGVDRLLTASGRLPSEAWRAALAAGRAQGRVGAELVDSGLITEVELEAVTLLALYDAAHVLFDAALAVRFEQGVQHPLGTRCALDLETVCAEVDRRKGALVEAWPDPVVDTAAVVPVRRLPDAYVALSALQWEVVANADRRRSPVDLARLLGRDAYTIMLEVRRMVRAGLVEPGRQTPSVAAESVATVRARAAVPVPVDVPADLPVDLPADLAVEQPAPVEPVGVVVLPRRPVPDEPPSTVGFEYCSEEILLRLRTGLAALR